MARNTSFLIDDHFDGFVKQQVSRGRYSSASEVVREGLRLLEQREADLQALQLGPDLRCFVGDPTGVRQDFPLVEGEESGPAAPLRMEEIKRKARARASRA